MTILERDAMQKAVDDAYYADNNIIALPTKDVITILDSLNKAEARIKALEFAFLRYEPCDCCVYQIDDFDMSPSPCHFCSPDDNWSNWEFEQARIEREKKDEH